MKGQQLQVMSKFSKKLPAVFDQNPPHTQIRVTVHCVFEGEKKA